METGVHNSWRLSPWSKKLHGAGLFIADEEEGQIEIPEAGLYLVYAQVKFVFFEKATKFDEISISLLTNKFVFFVSRYSFEHQSGSQFWNFIH